MSGSAFWFDEALLPDGWARGVRLVTAGGVIARIEADVPAGPQDERHGAALPGLPNLHSHAFQRGMAGLAERRGPGDDSFWTWRETMYRFADRVSPDDLQAIAALAFVEMLETGFTRVGEFHYLHHPPGGGRYADPAAMGAALVEAAAETGIALTLLPVLYQAGGFGGEAAGERQARFLNDLDGFARLHEAACRAAAVLPDTVVGVAPHSLRAVPPEALAEVARLAPDAPVHIHIAEQEREVQECLAWSGARPVEWLLDHAGVDARWCLVHATHMTEAETRALAASGAVAGLCPITEANLGDGLFPAEAFLAAGGTFGIGSDSNVLVDATEELRLLEYGQRLAHRRRNMLAEAGGATGDRLWRLAVAGGGQALGAASGFVPDAPADFLTLDRDHPSLVGRSGTALTDGLVFAAGRMGIAGVWRRGQRVVTNGRHHRRDPIVARYREVLAALLA